MIVRGKQYIMSKRGEGTLTLVVPDVGPPFFSGPGGAVDRKTAEAFIERYSNPGEHATHSWKEEEYVFDIGPNGVVTPATAEQIASLDPRVGGVVEDGAARALRSAQERVARKRAGKAGVK